jgi:UDP:flavonoid glycosyltransferase YjiC (YdhE family)
MHYGIVAIGSRGDVQPYTALALGLMARGHEATGMAHENFKDFVEGYGVAFVPLRGNVEEMLQSEEGMQVLRAGDIVAFSAYLKKIKIFRSKNSPLQNYCRPSKKFITRKCNKTQLRWVRRSTGEMV